MECYEGATMIKTFRGLIVDGGTDTIVLHTNNGSTGYRIKKLEVFPYEPGKESTESTIQVWSVDPSLTSTTAVTVDFSNQELLAAGCFHDSSSEGTLNPMYVVFDNMVFNQDIYITHTDTNASQPINYYIELEQVKLDLSESTVATLKDLRNLEYPPAGG